MIPPESEALGKFGEETIRRALKDAQARGKVEFFCRPEWVVVPVSDRPYLMEVKTQEAFEAPPFDGHGLPTWQANRYMQLRERLVEPRTLLAVIDPSTDTLYRQWLDVLEVGKRFDTPGTRGGGSRRIYSLDSFVASSISLHRDER